MDGHGPQHVSAVETTIAILGALQEKESAGVSEIASALDMSKANVHKHLVTLCDHGFLRRDGQQYRLGLRFFELGAKARDHNPLYQEAAPKVAELAEVTNQTATLLIPSEGTGVYIRSIDAKRGGWGGEKEGDRRPLHETASGLAVLSCLPAAERSKLLAETDRTDSILEELQEIEEIGVAVTDEPQGDNRREIAAPVVSGDGEPLGAIALITDDGADRSDQIERNYEQLVKKTSEILSKRLRLRQEGERA